MIRPFSLPHLRLAALIAASVLALVPLLAVSQTLSPHLATSPASTAALAPARHVVPPAALSPVHGRALSQSPASTAPKVQKHRLSWPKVILLTAAAAVLTGWIVYEKTKPKYPPNPCYVAGCPGGPHP